MADILYSFKIHDKFQFELKFTYPLDRSRSANEYLVDTYVFLPNNLYVNSRTYTPEMFYGDLHKYIRLRTPVVRLKIMTENSEESPIVKLEDALRELLLNPEDSATGKIYEDRLKMFCSILKSALRDEEAALERGLNSSSVQHRITDYLDQTVLILDKFRALMDLLRTPGIMEKHCSSFKLVDEFLSITVNKYRYRLYLAIEKNPECRLWSGQVLARISAELRKEITYRKDSGYPSIPSRNSDNEELISRENILKKVMASVLFLKSDTRRDGVILTNLVFGIAAGVAMAFATVVTFLSQNLMFQEFSLTFCIIIILAYMGKDRIKELSRSYLYSKMRGYIYDYKTVIRSNLGREVGICKENFSFVSEAKLPEAVRSRRNKDFISELENGVVGESILHSKEHITLYSEHCEEIYRDFKVDGLVDIIRFNVRHFLLKMDNPVKEIFMPDEQGGIVKINAKRVYKIHLILHSRMNDGTDSYAVFRVTLARNGIKRVERLHTGD